MVCEQICSCGHKIDKARDKRLARLISYIHHTSEYRQYWYVGNTAQQCRLGLFQDTDFAGDLDVSKSTSGGVLCIFRSHTFVPTCARDKLQFDTPLQKRQEFVLMQVYAWTVFPLSNKIDGPKRATEKPIGSCQAKHA